MYFRRIFWINLLCNGNGEWKEDNYTIAPHFCGAKLLLWPNVAYSPLLSCTLYSSISLSGFPLRRRSCQKCNAFGIYWPRRSTIFFSLQQLFGTKWPTYSESRLSFYHFRIKRGRSGTSGKYGQAAKWIHAQHTLSRHGRLSKRPRIAHMCAVGVCNCISWRHSAVPSH